MATKHLFDKAQKTLYNRNGSKSTENALFKEVVCLRQEYQKSQSLSSYDMLARITEKKTSSQRAASLMWDAGVIGLSGKHRIEDCGMQVHILSDAEQERKRLEGGFYCGHRFCPACAWRTSRKNAVMIDCICKQATQDGHTLYFATLTVPNVGADELRDCVRNLGKWYNHLTKLKGYNKIAGHIRKVEVTYNATMDTYHPHLHVLWILPKRGVKQIPLSVQELTENWRRITGEHVVSAAQDVQRARIANRGAVFELAKYTAKSSDYLQGYNQIRAFVNALTNARLVTFAGKAAIYRDMYKNGELDKHKQIDCTQYYFRETYNWVCNSEYVITSADKLEEPLTLQIDEEGGEED